MEKPTFKLVGASCSQHGQYTFHKAFRYTINNGVTKQDKVVALGDFFFVKVWQDSELVSIAELQLLWTDRVSDQTLVSLRLYFLPDNTPEGRGLHGEDEVIAINEKVVLKIEDLLTWICDGSGWKWGVKAVYRGDCAPSAEPVTTIEDSELTTTKLDFADVDTEKNAMEDPEQRGVVVFSYPRYCRYRAVQRRLEGVQSKWLRDSLVGALGGYAAPTRHTRILFCKDTFEYPELEGNEMVCNHMAPRLKGRPRGRRRRRTSPGQHSDSDSSLTTPSKVTPSKTRRKSSDEESNGNHEKAFITQLKTFHKQHSPGLNTATLKRDMNLRGLYKEVLACGGYEAACKQRAWNQFNHLPSAKRAYEKYLLPFEKFEKRNGSKWEKLMKNGEVESPKPNTEKARLIDTIDISESPCKESPIKCEDKIIPKLRTPSPEPKKPDINQDFLDSLPKAENSSSKDVEVKPPLKISVKPVEKLIDPKVADVTQDEPLINIIKILKVPPSESKCEVYQNNPAFKESILAQMVANPALKESLIAQMSSQEYESQVLKEKIFTQLASNPALKDAFLVQMAANSGLEPSVLGKNPLFEASKMDVSDLSGLNMSNGIPNGTLHTSTDGQKSTSPLRPAVRSSLRSVRVKPARNRSSPTSTGSWSGVQPDSASSSPPAQPPTLSHAPPTPAATNFGINYPPRPQVSSTTNQSDNNQSDDEIVEVPYKPKTPEIIDLDEYESPESPQTVKRKKLDILKERGLEVTALPTEFPQVPVIQTNPMLGLNPAVQQQILTQAQFFQMYNTILPAGNANGLQPPKVMQAQSIYGSSGPEKTVYGNPKDLFMPPPHILAGTAVKPKRSVSIPTTTASANELLDLTCKTSPKPAVEIVRVPSVPPKPQNLSSKGTYSLVDGKAVVGSNLEITLVSPKPSVTPPKVQRTPQKRTSTGKFMSNKTPPKENSYSTPLSKNLTVPRLPSPKKANLVIPSYSVTNRDPESTPSSSRPDSSSNSLANLLQNPFLHKNANLAQLIDPMYMSAIYSSLAGQFAPGMPPTDHLAFYKELSNRFLCNYTGVSPPTTKN